ncbi:MAG: FAD-binding protein [Lentimicrobiaceae bacterium]|nr:FAD-binding protein [Lentimicrobiaceae bacterium]
MRKIIDMRLNPSDAYVPARWKYMASLMLGIAPGRIYHITPIRLSMDARNKVVFRLKAEIFIGEHLPQEERVFKTALPDVSSRSPVIVVGAGPAGLFAALALVQRGFKPIVIERGKTIQGRKYDIALLNRGEKLNPESNYCFGEGGAGTFSDGKLYTRSTKRGDVTSILRTLVEHGAADNILFDAHPHIGTDKLPGIITSMRRSLLEAGAEFHFNTRVTGFLVSKGRIKGIRDSAGNNFKAGAVILATGHSAHDVYEMMHKEGYALEARPFALGVRVEHPQKLIDEIQYGMADRGRYIPAASYSLVTQAAGRGVFSFCMCPGGTIVPAATGKGQAVVNGMSNSGRTSPFANSGMVVALEKSDWEEFAKHGPLAALAMQHHIEHQAWKVTGDFRIPAQRLTDFLDGIVSVNLPGSSYHPGLLCHDLNAILPSFISERLKLAFADFNQKMKGFISAEAIVTAVESRTSTPVRIPRDPETLCHPQLMGLYPCGEGSGYAGGIVSSAMDGQKSAQVAAARYIPA